MKFKLQVHLPQYITKWFPLAIWRMPENSKTVYLTFDDGPIPEVTPWVLDLLRTNKIEATFFAVGENVFRYPESLNRLLMMAMLLAITLTIIYRDSNLIISLIIRILFRQIN